MVLYEYPSKLEKAAERRELALMTARKRKLGMRSLLTYASAAAIIAVGLTADTLTAKAAICLLGVIIAVLCFVTTAYLSLGLTSEHTLVTDDGFVHETKAVFGKTERYEIEFTHIKQTQQNGLGDLVISLESGDTVTVPFRVAKTKLFLVKNMSEQLKYAAKKYNDIEDDESDGKDWVDRL